MTERTVNGTLTLNIEVSEWQNMKTAPKDGRPILILFGTDDVASVGWHADRWMRVTHPESYGPELAQAWMPMPAGPAF